MMPFDDPTPPPPAAVAARSPSMMPRDDVPPPADVRLHGASAPAAVEALLNAHGAEVYRHLRRLAPTAEDAADLHQETFLRALRALPTLPADANHRAWLHRIAANAATDAHRRRAVRADAHHLGAGPDLAEGSTVDRDPPRGRATIESLDEALPTPDPAADPARRAEAAELRSTVRAALADLPWRERTAVVARVLDGHDYADVADALDCSEANARQLVSRGIRRVRTALAPYLETDR